jgi:phosphopantothenoylcysteine decarboxylase / phosphopantothenate---cysteine ligase
MTEPEGIFARCQVLLGAGGPLQGRRVLVSAGGTREPLDAVRFLGNRSSGRMGVALAEEARRRGAEVTLLAANLAVRPPGGIEVVQTPTAADMATAADARRDYDVFVMAAAVADYRPAAPEPGKRPKDTDDWTVRLEPTRDILRALGEARQNGQVLVGFAADTGEQGRARAREKLERKRADLIVFNDVAQEGIGFDAADNEVVLISRDGERTVPRARKDAVAAAVIDAVEELLP